MKCVVCEKESGERKVCKTCLRFLKWKYKGDLEEAFAHLEQIHNGGGKDVRR